MPIDDVADDVSIFPGPVFRRNYKIIIFSDVVFALRTYGRKLNRYFINEQTPGGNGKAFEKKKTNTPFNQAN